MENVQATLRRWDVQMAVALTLIVQMAISLMFASTPILAPAIAAERNWSVTVIALYPIAVYGTAFLVSFIIPGILFRVGGMGMAVACLMMCALGIPCLLSPSPYLILAAPILLGFAVGGMNPASSQILGPRISSRNAGLIMSIKSTGIPLGIMLAGTLVPVLVGWSGWRHAILWLSLLATAMSVMLLPSVPWFNRRDIRSRTAGSRRTLDPIMRLLAIPGMARFLVAAGIFGAMQLCLRTFFVVHLVADVGLSLATAGLALSISHAAAVLGQIIWATASDRMLSTPVTMSIVGLLMTLAAVLTANIASDWPSIWIFAIAALYGISAGGYYPLVLAEVARRSSDGDAGSLTAAAQVVLIPIGLSGPLVFGAIASVGSFSIAFIAVAAVTIIGSIVAAPKELSLLR